MHEELIAEIERAEVGSQVLDEKIRLLLVARRLAEGNDGADVRREMGGWSLNDPDSNVPHYSTSLDAVLQLVPEGYSWSCYAHPKRGEVEPAPRSYCSIYLLDEEATKTELGALDRGVISGPFDGESATPALALCLACLRARQPATSEADTG